MEIRKPMEKWFPPRKPGDEAVGERSQSGQAESEESGDDRSSAAPVCLGCGMRMTEPVENHEAEPELAAALMRGDRRALARALTAVESGGAQRLVELCRRQAEAGRRSVRLGLTGAPGAGKSTLLEALARRLRAEGRTVAVLAVDPSSPVTGGAVLGDRIRMREMAGDEGVFIRSMATRGHLGGLAAAAEDALLVMEAAGWDALLIETTGVGQGEVEIARCADAVAVVMAPGMGDGVQAMKAGVLEIADVLALNKADAAGIDELEQDMAAMEALNEAVSGRAQRRIVRTVATRGEGVEALLAAMMDVARRRVSGGRQGEREESERPLNVGPVAKAGPVIDHLGIAVRSLDAAERLYGLLGLVATGRETVAAERVRVAMLAAGESRIELLEATDEDSAIAKYIARRGEGLHHLALRVSDLEVVVERLRAQGVRLVKDEILVGAGGHRYVFVHPSSARGVLLELVEAAQ